MKYLVAAAALMVATPAMADKFEGVIPENVCWFEDVAFGLGSYNTKVSSQFRGAAPSAHNTGYGLFCFMRNGNPTWVYMDYDHEQERWVESSLPIYEE